MEGLVDVNAEIERAIAEAIPGARVEVQNASPGHFVITVRSQAFEGKRLLEKQRMVLSAIKHLMAGDAAPVHAVDKIHALTE